MPFFPMLLYNELLEPRATSRTLNRFLDIENHPSPFTIRRHTCPVARKDNSSIITSDKNTFHVSLDVQQFTPEELTVKTLDNNMIQVEGKHEEREDEHGFISRHFIRKYTLPNGHDTKNVTSSLSSDGVLTIVSKKRKHDCEEREIPIKLTGPSKPALSNGTDNQESKNEDEPKEKKTKN